MMGTPKPEWVPLASVCEVSPREAAIPSEAPFVPMDAVQVGKLHPAYTEPRGSRGGVRARGGDVLFARITPCLENGKVALLPESWGPVGGSTEFLVLRPSSALDSGFLYYWSLHPEVRRAAKASMSGVTGRMRLGRQAMSRFAIPLVSISEQRRIVAILEEHLTSLDDAVRSLRHVRDRSELLWQAFVDSRLASAIADAFQSEEIQAPGAGRQPDLEFVNAAWTGRFASLESLTDPKRVVRYGILKPQSGGRGGDVPYVEVRDLRAPLVCADLKRTTRELDEQFAGARLRGGDVIIAVRGSYERSQLVPGELEGANISRDVARIAPLPGLNPRFLHYWLQSTTTKRYLHRHARGVAVKGVNIASLRALPVPLLPMSIQSSSVAEISSMEDSRARLSSASAAAERRAELLRRSCLVAAFSGRLTGRPSDTGIIEELADEESA